MAPLTSLLADQRGTVFVRYSSLALLVAIAAIAIISQTDNILPGWPAQ